MRVKLDCVPCSLKQALEAGRLATDDSKVQETILLKSLEALLHYESCQTPAQLGGVVHALAREYSGNPDPYSRVKRDSIEMAQGIYPKLKDMVEEAEDSLYQAVKVSAVGNLLDAGVYGDLGLLDLQSWIEDELDKGFAYCDLKSLRDELSDAETVVVIGDNAGESVFDRILIGAIRRTIGEGKKAKVFYGVRSAPVINDVTFEDAIASGLEEDAIIISTGCSEPGLVLEEATSEFLQIYKEADVVISKGQGNYETLGDSARRPVYFLLKAKCMVIATDLGVNPGDYVLLHKTNR